MKRIQYYGHLVLTLISVFTGPIILFVYFNDPGAGLPEYEALTLVQGKIAWVQTAKYGVKFGMKNNQLNFSYPLKAKGMHRVKQALSNAGLEEIQVRARLTDSFSPMYSDKSYHTEFEVIVGDRVIRSYAQVSQAVLADNKLIAYIGFIFLFGGIVMTIQARRKRKAN